MKAVAERRTASVDETAVFLGTGRNATYDAIHRGEIPHIRIGKRILVPRDWIDRVLSGEIIQRSRAE